jgi:DNA polymerase
MEEFSEESLAQLISEALDQKGNNLLYPASGMHLSFMDTDILSLVYDKISNKMTLSEASEILQEVRDEILTRKISMPITDLHTVTHNCNKCKIDATAELPKWNVKDPDLVIVIESPSMDPNAISFMVDQIKKSGFASHQLCLTYVNRCPKQQKYEQEEIINCSPYLHTELQILNPKLIVSMGGLSTSVLFGTEIKMKEYRGNIVWLGNWPILPTYSPGYVLKSGGSSMQHFSDDLSQAYEFVASKKKVTA